MCSTFLTEDAGEPALGAPLLEPPALPPCLLREFSARNAGREVVLELGLSDVQRPTRVHGYVLAGVEHGHGPATVRCRLGGARAGDPPLELALPDVERLVIERDGDGRESSLRVEARGGWAALVLAAPGRSPRQECRSQVGSVP